jgi:hypothetical protein
VESGGGAGTEDGGVGTFPVPKAVAIIARDGGDVGVGGFGSWDGAVVSSDGAEVDAAGAGSGRAATGVTADGLVRLAPRSHREAADAAHWATMWRLVRLTGVGAGEAAGRGAIDVTAEWGDATLEAPIVTLGGACLAAVTRFGLAF